MATSGTIAQTTFNTRKVVDNAYGMCRLPRQAITGELINTALEQLGLMLSAWANVGVPLWCQTKYVLPLYEGTYEVPTPAGTVDILNANLRTLNRLAGTATSSTGVSANAFDNDFATVCALVGVTAQNITLQLETASIITTMGFLPGSSGTWDVTLQYSPDGVTWTTFYNDPAYVAADEEWNWLDFQGLPTVAYWRFQVAAASLPVSIREIAWMNTPSEITLARINKDDWFSLPNKSFRGRPVQFWNDRRRAGPVLNIWPAPDTAARYYQIVVLVHRQIMDVGTLRQDIEVPQRAFEFVVANLAAKLAVMTPEVKIEMIKFTREEAARASSLFWGEERDNSPINIELDISPYTR